MKLCNVNEMKSYYFQIISLLWILTFCGNFESSLGLFFPFFGNFFNKMRNNSQFQNGGVSAFSERIGNLTNFPIQASPADRRVDVVTTVVSNTGDQPQVHVLKNVNETAAAEHLLRSAGLQVPTSVSVTSSISSSQQGVASSDIQPKSLTVPFTPNMSGMKSYMRALMDIKRNYKDLEKERKLELFNKGSGDLMTRVMRTLVQKMVNKHQKHTQMLQLKIQKRQDKLQNFLQLPMVSHVVSSDAAQPVPLRRSGLSNPIGSNQNQQRKRFPTIFDFFLI